MPDPLAIASTVANVAGAGMFSGGPEQKQGNLHLANPAQLALYNALAQRSLSGAGDFGYGQAAKQGKGQVQQFLADHGIDQNSGIGMGMQANAFGQASALDAQNRRSFDLSLLGTPLQVLHATGGNFIPGSPSAGFSTGAQEGSFNNWSNTGALPYSVGPGGQPITWGNGSRAGWNTPENTGNRVGQRVNNYLTGG